MSEKAFQQIRKGVAAARSGSLTTRRGKVLTPLFMPVATRGAVKGLDPDNVAATGAQILLANTYHLHLQPGEDTIHKLGGLHEFAKWPGPILTDSGGFQVFSLAKIREITEEGVYFKNPVTGDKIFISPEISIQIQVALGADIIMAFDDVTGLSEEDKGRTWEAYDRTHRWLLRCIAEFKKLTKTLPASDKPQLYGIIQGGLDENLRGKSLEFVQAQEVDGIAIGGLSVGEDRQQMHRMLDFLSTLYDPNKPHYLMGVGDPIDMRFAIERGVDLFDCVQPTRNARHGAVWIAKNQKMNLKNAVFIDDPRPIDEACDCSTCRDGYSRAFLRHLYKTANPLAGSLASVHNLRHLQRICESYR